MLILISEVKCQFIITAQVAEEFASLHPCVDVKLRDVWPKSALLEKADELSLNDADVHSIMDEIADQWDEGLTLNRSIVRRTLLCYVHIMAWAGRLSSCR